MIQDAWRCCTGMTRDMVRGGRLEGVQERELMYTCDTFKLMYGKINTIDIVINFPLK